MQNTISGQLAPLPNQAASPEVPAQSPSQETLLLFAVELEQQIAALEGEGLTGNTAGSVTSGSGYGTVQGIFPGTSSPGQSLVSPGSTMLSELTGPVLQSLLANSSAGSNTLPPSQGNLNSSLLSAADGLTTGLQSELAGAAGSALQASLTRLSDSQALPWTVQDLQALEGAQGPASFKSGAATANGSESTAQSGDTTGQINAAVASASLKYNVPASLIRAVIAQESGMNPDAVSSAGAVGLMQLMPATWQQFGVANPFDPVQNIMAGTQYLHNLIAQFGGRIDLALAAYNAGPGSVQAHGGIPPYPETMGYVQKVMQYARQFAQNA